MSFCTRTAAVLAMSLASVPALADPVVQTVDPAIPAAEAPVPAAPDTAMPAAASEASLAGAAQPDARSAGEGVIVFDLPPGEASPSACADVAASGCEVEGPPVPTTATCETGCLGAPPASPALEERGWADHVPSEYAARPGFWKQVGTVKTEALLMLGYFTVQSGSKLFNDTKPFGFKDEGWFGKNTSNVGVDKLAHVFNTYLMAEILHDRIHRRSGASEGDAVTAAVLASGLTIFNEFSDGIEPGGGFSFQDVVMDLAGAGFSVLRNTVPGLKEKVALKIEIMPNEDVYSYEGKPHYEQERFMLSIKGAGFEKLAKTPLRFLDLQVGYYASDFRISDREAGIEPKRHLFVGVGLNLGELLFGDSDSGFGKAAYSVLDYMQLPYTSIRYDTTGRLGY